MKQKRSSPNWWQLRLIVPLMLGMFVLDHKYLALSPLGHQLMLGATMILVYGLMAYWLYANQAAVQDTADEAGPWHNMEGLEADGQPTSSLEESGQNEPVAANRTNPTATALPAQTASICTTSKGGVSIRTWLN